MLEGRLVKFGHEVRRVANLKPRVCCFALIVNSDADQGMGWIPPASVRPTLAVETSPGNHQFWFFLDEAVSREQAQAVGRRASAGRLAPITTLGRRRSPIGSAAP